jgi:PAS domain S-box-containing protein
LNINNSLLQSPLHEAGNCLFDHNIIKRLIEKLPVPIIIFDKNLCFVAASDRFFEESPLQKKDVKPNDYWYNFVPDMPKKWKLIHQRCLSGEQLKGEEDPFYRDDGTIEWWRWEILPWYYADDEIAGLILYVENITQQKMIENDLRQNINSLKQTNDSLSKFAHVCAHDLNQSMRAVSLYAQLIKMDYADTIDESLKGYLNLIVKNVEYMKSFISNYLEYVHSTDKDSLFQGLSMDDVIANVMMVLETEIRSKNATINYPRMPRVYGNKILLTQLMQNLISNALKYNNTDSPVIDISITDKGEIWLFSIQDNGIGIEAKYLKKIFTPYKRVTSDTPCEGTGLGLYQCKKIIRDHGGKIWASSTVGEGTTMFFTLPKEMDL